jgi:KilA-N domain
MNSGTLVDLIQESYNPEYGWGQYGNYQLFIRRSDGYVNATKLCEDNNKDIYNWMILDVTKVLVREMIKLLERSPSKFQNHKSKIIQGIYVHPFMVPHIINWIQPSFMITMAELTNKSILTCFQNNSLKEISSKLDRVVKTIQQLNIGMERLLTEIDHENGETYVFYICEQNEQNALYFQYHACPQQLDIFLSKMKKRYPRMRELIRFESVSNAFELSNEFMRRVSNRVVDGEYQTFILSEPFDEQRVVVLVNAIFEERAIYTC